MGLDMFAHKVSPKRVPEGAVVDFDIGEAVNEGDRCENLHYWRKHPDLHGWMQRLYVEKGGKSSNPGDFNCVNVAITADDLDRLEKDLNAASLPRTEGFFFGQSHPDDVQGDLEFVRKAREAISDGFVVVYSSWW